MNLPICPSNGTDSGQIGMSLATIAYAAESDIPTLLANTKLTQTWTMEWFGCDDASQVFVAKDSVSGQLAVCIRGTFGNPSEASFWLDWFEEDLNVLEMTAWPWPGAPAGAKIAKGTLDGLNSIRALTCAHGKTIEQYLEAHLTGGSPPLTAVVGHSLGGTLGSVLPAYLSQAVSASGATFWGVTFAGATPGNSVLADWLTNSFNGSNGRYWNDFDVVPHAWKALGWIAGSFSEGPTCPSGIQDVIEATRLILWGLSDDYETLGGGVPLFSSLSQSESWVQEVGHQHACNTYLALLGAPLITLPVSSDQITKA